MVFHLLAFTKDIFHWGTKYPNFSVLIMDLSDFIFLIHCRRKKHLVTFPNLAKDFSLQNLGFTRPCYRCNALDQESKLVYDRYCVFYVSLVWDFQVNCVCH